MQHLESQRNKEPLTQGECAFSCVRAGPIKQAEHSGPSDQNVTYLGELVEMKLSDTYLGEVNTWTSLDDDEPGWKYGLVGQRVDLL